MASFVITLRSWVESRGPRSVTSQRSRVSCRGCCVFALDGSAASCGAERLGGRLAPCPACALGREVLHVLISCSWRCCLAAWLPHLLPDPPECPRPEESSGREPEGQVAPSPGLPLSPAQTPAAPHRQPRLPKPCPSGSPRPCLPVTCS